jgi:hypothetical protein
VPRRNLRKSARARAGAEGASRCTAHNVHFRVEEEASENGGTDDNTIVQTCLLF